MKIPRHCCDDMRVALTSSCAQHPDRFDCPDALVDYIPKFDEYGLIIHDGGRSAFVIRFCPFCGAILPESKRDKWFETLEALCIDPWARRFPNLSAMTNGGGTLANTNNVAAAKPRATVI